MNNTKLYEDWIIDNLYSGDADKFKIDLTKHSLSEQKMFNPFTAQATEILRYELYKSYEGLIPFSIYSMIFNNNLDKFLNSLEVDVGAGITNTEDYKNAAEDECKSNN